MMEKKWFWIPELMVVLGIIGILEGANALYPITGPIYQYLHMTFDPPTAWVPGTKGKDACWNYVYADRVGDGNGWVEGENEDSRRQIPGRQDLIRELADAGIVNAYSPNYSHKTIREAVDAGIVNGVGRPEYRNSEGSGWGTEILLSIICYTEGHDPRTGESR